MSWTTRLHSLPGPEKLWILVLNYAAFVRRQVSMKLKLAQMWDHNGTNMEAIGFMYRTNKILIALNDNQELTGDRTLLCPSLSAFI